MLHVVGAQLRAIALSDPFLTSTTVVAPNTIDGA
jgi:hypothetical protein